ncbi:MAG: VCBS repeat-containing protein [Chloroflexi bacterium]|nr:VCBS repeat-containing protein [Chloroflexota bacterium]
MRLFDVSLPGKLVQGVACLSLILAMAIVLACQNDRDGSDEGSTDQSAITPSPLSDEFRPFTNIAPESLGQGAEIMNRYPGVVIFDFDRDGDLDFYVTSAESEAPIEQARGGANRLFRNDAGSYVDVVVAAGVGAPEHNSSAVAACDFNNDGFQDLYVGAMGRVGDDLDYRSIEPGSELATVAGDRLFINQRNGTFIDRTIDWFGAQINVRSAGSIACGDVDNDGWLDLFVGNRSDVDFTTFNEASHPGHYNVMYRNTGASSFVDVTAESRLLSPPIAMLDSKGAPITFSDPVTGDVFEGFDPTHLDAAGNLAGDPTGETWASLFFDHDDDGDVDLWIADDGDRLKVYRNDSRGTNFRFTDISAPMGIDQSGAWMGFALGDYDGDADLDIFITNIGFHPITRGPNTAPGGACSYAANFQWGTCYHYLLRNDGTINAPSVGTIGVFPDVAWSTEIEPSKGAPPESLNPNKVHPFWRTPTGLAAYDFGFGTAFFDYENDGDQDLYWLGAIISAGEGPGGNLFPGYGC